MSFYGWCWVAAVCAASLYLLIALFLLASWVVARAHRRRVDTRPRA